MISIVTSLDASIPIPLYVQLYQYIKDEIEHGRINAHERISSVRQTAKSLDISRTTVENAYNQLVMEGYIYSSIKRGYYVCDLGSMGDEKEHVERLEVEEGTIAKRKRYSDQGNFDFNTWRKYYNRVLMYRSSEHMFRGDCQGEEELRIQISQYVYKARGVNCKRMQVVTGAGVQVLLGILSMILKKSGIDTIALEDPGFTDVKHTLSDHFFDIEPISVTDTGIELRQLEKIDRGVCYVSPTHQYPTGKIMPVKKRIKLLNWANSSNSYIIEDDYDSELRYSGRPVPSLQGLDSNDRVVYLGSFSTLFLPSLRISYMILPLSLLDIYLDIKDRYNQTVSKIDQMTLAEYMKEGQFERHLRRIRKRFSQKHEIFSSLLTKHLDKRIEIFKSDSGVNMLFLLPEYLKAESVKAKAERVGFQSRFMNNNMLLVKFTDIPFESMEESAQKLAWVLNGGKVVDNINNG